LADGVGSSLSTRCPIPDSQLPDVHQFPLPFRTFQSFGLKALYRRQSLGKLTLADSPIFLRSPTAPIITNRTRCRIIVPDPLPSARSGPYRTIRHPIYTGILLAFLGTAVQIGQVRGFLAFVIAWACFYVKARREESFLADEFGDRFAEHRQRTGMFLPRLS